MPHYRGGDVRGLPWRVAALSICGDRRRQAMRAGSGSSCSCSPGGRAAPPVLKKPRRMTAANVSAAVILAETELAAGRGLLGSCAAILTGIAIKGADTSPLLGDTDDAMRLVIVRDFLGGQGWFDHAQYRLNVPFGAEMTWSRLVDVPIAGLILLLPACSPATMPRRSQPMRGRCGLLFVLLAVSAKLTLKLVGPEGVLPALVLPVLTPAVIARFSAGPIRPSRGADHPDAGDGLVHDRGARPPALGHRRLVLLQQQRSRWARRRCRASRQPRWRSASCGYFARSGRARW